MTLIFIASMLAASCADSTTNSSTMPSATESTEQIETTTSLTTPAPASTAGPSTAVSIDPTPPVTEAGPPSESTTTTGPTTDQSAPPSSLPASSASSTTDVVSPSTEPARQATSDTIAVYGGSGAPSVAWAPLGWWDGSAWNDAGFDEQGNFISPPEADIASVSASSLDFPDDADTVVDGLELGPPDFYCVGDETGRIIDLGVDLPETDVSLSYNAIAATADWPLQPRAVREVGLDAPEYAALGAGFFDGVPGAEEGEVVQVVRVDLDGNGVEEVLVTYEHITEANFGAENDVSAIYVRYPSADGSVADELLVEYVLDDPVDFPTVGRFTIAAVADLNGDAVMEVAIRSMFWESAGMTVYEFRGGRLVPILDNGCGV